MVAQTALKASTLGRQNTTPCSADLGPGTIMQQDSNEQKIRRSALYKGAVI